MRPDLTSTLSSRSRTTDVAGFVLHPTLPFAGRELLRFLRGRAIPGVELVDDASYARTFVVGRSRGVVRTTLSADERRIDVQLDPALARHRDDVSARLALLFDLSAPASAIDAQLAHDALLAQSVRERPGLRLPGAFDAWEIAVRAVLGQQVSVKGARTLAGRLVQRFGTELSSPSAAADPGTPSFGFPTERTLARLTARDVQPIGIPLARAETLVSLARLLDAEPSLLAPGARTEHAFSALQTIPGIGPWTAGYIVMRCLAAADVFLPGDLGAKKALAVATEREAERVSQRFRPYRAYALMHLWATLHG